jgi:hypothetical protein
MEWEKDSEALERFDRLMNEVSNPLSDFMNTLHEKEMLGEGNLALLLRIIARAVINYTQFSEYMDEYDAIQATKAELMEDPILIHLVQQSAGQGLAGAF